MSNTYELRAELERDFAAVLLTGLARRACTPDDALDVCPLDMLTEGSVPWAAYRAVAEMHVRGLRPTVDGIYAHITADRQAAKAGRISARRISPSCASAPSASTTACAITPPWRFGKGSSTGLKSR